MQVMKLLKTVCLLVIVTNLSACSMLGLELFGEEGFFRDRQGDYLEAESIPRIVVPADKDSYIIDDLLVIPDLSTATEDTFVQAPRPRPLQGNPDQSVVIQRMNTSSWAVIDTSVSQVWPRVRQYWLEKGIELSLENPVDGLLDTEWFIEDGNVETQEKFRVLVEPGFQDESAEVSLIHLSVPQDQEVFNQVNWPGQSMDPEYADEILNEISVFLANDIRNYQASTVSFLAGNVSSEGRAALLTEGGINMLHLNADFERSFAAVGRALERAGIEIIDENELEGSFSVSFGEVEETNDTGLLGRILSVANSPERRPISVFLEESGEGIDVVALRVVDINSTYNENLTDAEIDIQEQQYVELINSLVQAIRDYI